MSTVLSPWGNCRDSFCLCVGHGQGGHHSFHVLVFVSLVSMLCLFSHSEFKKKKVIEIFCPLKSPFEDKTDSKELLKERFCLRPFVCEHLIKLG